MHCSSFVGDTGHAVRLRLLVPRRSTGHDVRCSVPTSARTTGRRPTASAVCETEHSCSALGRCSWRARRLPRPFARDVTWKSPRKAQRGPRTFDLLDYRNNLGDKGSKIFGVSEEANRRCILVVSSLDHGGRVRLDRVKADGCACPFRCLTLKTF